MKTGEITIKDIIGWAIFFVIVGFNAFYAYHIGALKDERIKNLENQSFYWEKRSNELKLNLDRMKAEADQIIEQCNKSQDKAEALEKSKEIIDANWRKSIPVRFPPKE
ncbi:hypothetical protein KJ830_01015 [bacterium]|nr:hypothetical protein [bacterium]